jgi:hypothetical protein
MDRRGSLTSMNSVATTATTDSSSSGGKVGHDFIPFFLAPPICHIRSCILHLTTISLYNYFVVCYYTYRFLLEAIISPDSEYIVSCCSYNIFI